MSKRHIFNRMSAREWAWGTTAYWKIYSNVGGAITSTQRKALSYRFTRSITNGNSKSARQHHGCQEKSSKSSYCVMKGRFSNGFQHRLRHSKELIKIRNCSTSGNKQLRRFLSTSCMRLNLDEPDIEVLSSSEINSVLRLNEKTFSDFLSSSITSCCTNQLPSNQPMEDQLILTTVNNGKSLLAGVVDGHGGFQFGRVVQQRLPFYIAAMLLGDCNSVDFDSNESLIDFVQFLIDEHYDNINQNKNDLHWLGQLHSMIEDSRSKQEISDSYISKMSNPLRQIFGTEVLGNYTNMDDDTDVKTLLRGAFLHLDQDLISEVKQHSTMPPAELDIETFYKGLSTSGCCALMMYLEGNDLYIANAGDCRAVLGSQGSSGVIAVQLTQDHTAASNPEEVTRILLEHPPGESRSCIQYGRLLGRLAPLRAFGDIQFKLNPDTQTKIIGRHLPSFRVMPAVKTPPYLTAEPDVHHFNLQSDDKFVILASDGLWDMLSNEEVVYLVNGFMKGNAAHLLREKAILNGIDPDHDLLTDIETTIEDDNVATFLIRYALGGANRHALSAMLTLPHPDVRIYRDDITVIVVNLDINEF